MSHWLSIMVAVNSNIANLYKKSKLPQIHKRRAKILYLLYEKQILLVQGCGRII